MSLVGTILDERYELLEEIGSGGMAVVYRAEQIRMKREVAVKLLRGRMRHDRRSAARFVREARLTAMLDHVNVVRTIDFGDAEAGMYLVMELLRGRTLDDHVHRHGPLAGDSAMVLGQQVASGLAAAHALGIVHRDLKPGNVLLHRTRAGATAKVLDFGIARMLESAQRDARGLYETTVGVGGPKDMLGTIGYASPEQIRGQPIDHRADIYALGCLLYSVLAGVPPFVRDTRFAVMAAHIEEAPEPLPDTVPRQLVVLIRQLMAKERADRPPDAASVAGLLRRMIADRAVHAGV